MEYKYRYLHICPPSTRMLKGYVTLLHKYFSIEDHHFLCRTQSNGGDGFTVITKNVTNFNDMGKGKIRKFFALRRMLRNSQTIVIHGFMFPLPWLIFLYFHRHFLKKALWAIWGVDIYNFHRENGNPLINRIINHMEDEVRKAVKTPVVLFPTDFAVYKKVFGEDGKPVMCAPLGTPDIVFNEWDNIIKERQIVYDKYFGGDRNSPNREKSIQVGHNAFPFNKHGEILTSIEKFKDKNIKITLPLSYGNDYGDTNSNYVKNIKGLIRNLSMTEKCRILEKLMPKSTYFKFLGAVDVAILNANRQNALGNILPLLYMGKKVYLSKDNPLYHFFTGEGFEIHETEELQSVSFEEFIKPTEKPFPDPWFKIFYSFEYCALKWKVAFEYTDGKYSVAEALSRMADIEQEQRVKLEEERSVFYGKFNEEQNMRKALDKDKEMQNILAAEYEAVAAWLEKREKEEEAAHKEQEKRKAAWRARVEEYHANMKRLEEEKDRLEKERIKLEEEKDRQEKERIKLQERKQPRIRCELFEKEDDWGVNSGRKEKYLLVIERGTPEK